MNKTGPLASTPAKGEATHGSAGEDVPARIVAGEDACAPSVNNVTNTTYIYE